MYLSPQQPSISNRYVFFLQHFRKTMVNTLSWNQNYFPFDKLQNLRKFSFILNCGLEFAAGNIFRIITSQLRYPLRAYCIVFLCDQVGCYKDINDIKKGKIGNGQNFAIEIFLINLQTVYIVCLSRMSISIPKYLDRKSITMPAVAERLSTHWKSRQYLTVQA